MSNHLNTIAYYVGLIIRKALIFFIVLPASGIFLFLMMFYQFDFHAITKDVYEYISDVSQVPAESPKHVNVLRCAVSDMPIDKADTAEKYICEKEQIVSMLIEDAARSAANDLYRLYWILTILFGAIYLTIRFMWEYKGYSSGGKFISPETLGTAQRREH